MEAHGLAELQKTLVQTSGCPESSKGFRQKICIVGGWEMFELRRFFFFFSFLEAFFPSAAAVAAAARAFSSFIRFMIPL